MKKLEYFLKIVRTSIISDKNYLTKKFMKKIKYSPNFDFPESFNEKINHRILYDRNPLFTQLADKLLVRDFIKQKIGEDYLVPLLKCYNKTQQINLDELPEQFVLKCNHDSGSSIICHSKHHFDLSKAKKKSLIFILCVIFIILRVKNTIKILMLKLFAKSILIYLVRIIVC